MLFALNSLEKNRPPTVPAGLPWPSAGEAWQIWVSCLIESPNWDLWIPIFVSRFAMFYTKQIQRPENWCCEKTRQKPKTSGSVRSREQVLSYLHCSALTLPIFSIFPRRYNWNMIIYNPATFEMAEHSTEFSFQFSALTRTLKSPTKPL